MEIEINDGDIASDVNSASVKVEKRTLTHYDGMTHEVTVVDEEFPYPEGELIISRTDINGTITHTNRAFVILSGYTKEELVGQPHHILRHPDMPKAAFKDLWDTVQTGRKWNGYVKNRRKDGRYYWVYATIVPNFDQNKRIKGFTSVRRQPSREKVKYCTKLYKEMLDQEK